MICICNIQAMEQARPRSMRPTRSRVDPVPASPKTETVVSTGDAHGASPWRTSTFCDTRTLTSVLPLNLCTSRISPVCGSEGGENEQNALWAAGTL